MLRTTNLHSMAAMLALVVLAAAVLTPALAQIPADAQAQEEASTPAEAQAPSESETPTDVETPAVDEAPAEPRQLIDGIAAVVGDEIILESEVDEEFYIYQMRTGARVLADEAERIRSEIVHEMVDEMLLVAKARRDSILLDEGELDGEIERRVTELRERHGSEEALEEALAQEGVTLEDLKRIYADDIERRLLAQKVVGREVHSKIDVTWGEVEEYYEAHSDEVGAVPEAFRLAGILVAARPSEAAKTAAIQKMNEARSRLEEGTPFEQVAAEFSDDASAARGGDLGTFGRGTMVPEFEEAVFALAPGEVSGIVPTRFGFHIIQVTEVEGEEVHARHILARVTPGPEDNERANARAESLRQLAVDGADFEALATEHSDDETSRSNGGVLGWFREGDMAPAIEGAVSELSAGELAPVVPGDNGFYVIKLLEHEEERVASLDEVREDLREYIYGLKAEEAYTALMDRLSGEIFIDIRTGTP
jgi:peptidyl-prolyl cis-trans isomerase SurA